MEVLVGTGGLLVALGGAGTYYAQVQTHKARCMKDAPLINLEDKEEATKWRNRITQLVNNPTEGQSTFVKVIGSASVGSHEPVKVEGYTRDMTYYRRIVKGRSVQSPWSPLAPFKVTKNGHKEYVITPNLDQKALVWGIQHLEGTKKRSNGRFVEVSSKFVPEDADLVLISETEIPTGSRFLSSLTSLISWPYPYATIIQERGLPVGSRVLVAGEAGISKETGKPIILPPKVGFWPYPSIISTRPEEDWINTYESTAFTYHALSSSAIALGIVMMAYGKFGKHGNQK